MEKITVSFGQAINFCNDEHYKSFIKDFDGQRKVHELVELYAEKYPEEAKRLLEMPLPKWTLPQSEPEETPVEKVLGRMYNWKQNSALRYAKEIKDFPEEALKKLEYLAEKFGNCGWQDGSIYDELRDTNFEVAKMLGYEYNEEKDWFLPIKV